LQPRARHRLHRRRIDAAIVHAAISAFIAAIRLPDDWRARALAAAARDETALHRQERRTALERKRARFKGGMMARCGVAMGGMTMRSGRG
jgi:hypothetical protein